MNRQCKPIEKDGPLAITISIEYIWVNSHMDNQVNSKHLMDGRKGIDMQTNS